MRRGMNARLLGYSDEEKKLYIQIDGLSYYTLERALKKRYMPNIKKLLKIKGYKLYRVFSEIPSNTPAAQMKIMYGIKDKIPGFRWYDKQANIHHTFKDPKTALFWEEYAEKNSSKKLLEDGASYINLFSGGAKRVVLNLSHAFIMKKKKEISNLNLWKFIFINLDFIFKVIIKIIKEILVENYEYWKYKIKKNTSKKSDVVCLHEDNK